MDPFLALIGQRRGFARGEVRWTAERARPQGVVVHLSSGALCMIPPLQAPAGPYGPASLDHAPLYGGWVVPGITIPYTHPVPIPQYHTPPVHPCTPTTSPRDRAPRACTYDSFEDTVGEPRGVEYSQVSGSRTGLWTLDWFTRPFDWFNDCFRLVLLSLVPVLLSIVPDLLSLVPYLLRIDQNGPQN